jgi:drug/metabolite transporter (DMT)-like permease
MAALQNWSNRRANWNKWSAAVGFLASVGLVSGASNGLWQLAGIGLMVLNAFCFWKSRHAL